MLFSRQLQRTLQNVDLDAGLAISCSGEDLRLAGWQGGVAGNELGHDTSQCLQT